MNRSATQLRPLGRTGLMVTGIAIGAGPIGKVRGTSGPETAQQDGIATVRAVLAGPFNFIDTSNNYTDGQSERLIGQAIADAHGVPDGFVLATKVDGAQGVFDGDRVRRSLDESLQRLGVTRLPLLYLHDPHNFMTVAEAMSPTGPVAALAALKGEGVVDNIGIAMGPLNQSAEYVRSGVFDVVLTHNRFTLLDRSAEWLIDEARAAQLGIVNAAPYGGGILSKGPKSVSAYAYGEGSQAQSRAAAEMQAACDRAGIPLAAAAVQFSVRDPRIDSTVVGASRAEQVEALQGLLGTVIPDHLWAELETLVPPPAEWIPADR
jgi:D-threo-aldose 1-dehydrogenase